MTLVPAAIILVCTSTEAARHTVFTYVAITHLGGAGTWIALLLLAHAGAIGNPTALGEGSGVQAVIAVAAIVGFGTKAGLMPMHAWLPRTHPIAPAFVSALMSGVMVAVAAYGLIRVLVDWLGPPPAWVGATMLVLGGLSALGRHHLCALPARSEAASRLFDRRARRRRRAWSRCLSPVAPPRG